MAPEHSKRPNDDELLAKAIPIDAADDEDDALELEPEDDDPGASAGGSKIRTFDQRIPHEDHWKRQPNVTGHGAIHVKTFVAKLRPDAIAHLDEQINEWLDNHPEYEAKFVTTSVGQLVGKTTEDALFVNVWV
ncbi:MAG: hypothetical protein WD009_06065 [Phycisphaeraceae bacterium]